MRFISITCTSILLILIILLTLIFSGCITHLEKDSLENATLNNESPKTSISYAPNNSEIYIYQYTVRSKLSALKNIWDSLSTGYILFNPPSEMQVGVKEIIEIRISENLTQGLSEGLKGKGNQIIETIKIGPEMLVTLSGDKGDFEIIPRLPLERFMVQKNYTEWKWDVIPLRSGNKTLYLNVGVSLENGKYEWIPVKEKEIMVKVNPSWTAENFIKNEWKWIIASILAPILGFIVGRRWPSKS